MAEKRDTLLIQISNSDATKLMVYKLADDGKKLAMGHDVQWGAKEAGKWFCHCSIFRLKRSCTHVHDLPPAPLDVWEGVLTGSNPEINFEIADPVPAMVEDVGMILKDKSLNIDSRLMLISPIRSDVHLWEIMAGFGKDSTPCRFETLGSEPTELTNENGTLSRVSRELKGAFCQDQPFTSSDVMTQIDLTDFKTRPWSTTGDVATPKSVSATKARTGIPWKDTKPPVGFYVPDDVWEACLYSATKGSHVLAKGPTGCGKTELFYHVADALGIDCEPINFGAMTEARTSLIGATHFDPEAGTWMKESRYVTALQKDTGIILCDEVTRAPADAFNLVLPAMDRQGYVSLDEADDARVVYKGKHVAFFATANIGMEYTGTMAMDRAFEDRFAVVLDLNYPDPIAETRILAYRCPSVQKQVLSKLAEIAETQRGVADEGEFTRKISTRMLIDCGTLIGDGVSRDVAITMTILNKFDSEGDEQSERVMVAQIFQKEKLLSALK